MKKPKYCTYQCRYATLESFTKHSDIQNDITEAQYICSLYDTSLWGEEPVCNQSDWDNEQPLPTDNLTFYSYKEYTYQLTYNTTTQKVTGSCVELPELTYEDKDHVGCLIEIINLVEKTIENWMREKKLLPIPTKLHHPT